MYRLRFQACVFKLNLETLLASLASSIYLSSVFNNLTGAKEGEEDPPDQLVPSVFLVSRTLESVKTRTVVPLLHLEHSLKLEKCLRFENYQNY